MYTVSTSNRKTYHHGALGPALLDAADALLQEAGSGALSLREVARRAGVSPTACYRHFATREALLAALAERGFREFGMAMSAAVTQAENEARDRFAAMGVAYVLFAVARPGRFRLMFGPAIIDRRQYPGLKTIADAAFARLQQAASDGDAAPSGRVLTDDTGRAVNVAAIAAWSLVHGLSQLIIDGALPVEHAEALAKAVTSKRP